MPYYSGDETGEGGYWSGVLNRMLEDKDPYYYEDSNETSYNDPYGYGYDEGYGGYEKKAKGPVPLDYSVLSISILTLGLILFVEIARHSIDHAAHGRPFFKAVLLMVYSELATLGIVEFAVFLLIKYYDDLDKEKKEVFGDVHFALFYTAIFNAFQSTLTAIFTSGVSDRLWVQTEQLELDHYVEIREEYERVSMLIYGGENVTSKAGKWFRNFMLFLRRPGLRAKFHELRSQVRFHELRLHFIESNNLPLNLKVSDYLKRSEMGVLTGLVHVSAGAWLLLVSGMNVLYFILGMVGYTTGDPDAVGTCLTAVFFGLLIAFILVSLILRQKMETIFQKIMKTKIIDSAHREEGMQAQINLFWWGSPHLVVSIIQFMNFGYAIALAVVIMYWPYLTNEVEPYWYLVAVFVCYGVFLYNLSHLLPKFTLCTSLGYLINQKQLQETVARHRLEEVERQQWRKAIEKAIENDSVIVLATKAESTEPSTITGSSAPGTQATVASVMRSSANGVLPINDPKDVLLAGLVKSDTKSLRNLMPEESRGNLDRKQRRANRRSISDGVAAMRAMGTNNMSSLSLWDTEEKQEVNESQKLHRKLKMEARAASRRAGRTKSISQPSAIKGWQEITRAEDKGKNQSRSIDDADAAHLSNREKRHRRQKSNSESGVIGAWQDSARPGEQSTLSTLHEVPLSKQNEENNAQWKKDRAERLSARRQARKKAVSASAVIQSWRDFSVTDHMVRRNDLEPIPYEEAAEDHVMSADETTASNDNQVLLPAEPSLKGVEEDDLTEDELKTESSSLRKDRSEDDDIETYDSDKSVGNLSDVDVVETVRGLAPRLIVETVDPWYKRIQSYFTPSAIIGNTKHYFLSSQYRSVSHVFGTMVIFFLIGHRVEAFIAKTDRVLIADDGWGTNLMFMYWCEYAFLACFFLSAVIQLILFPLPWCRDARERAAALAAAIDLVLTGMVMALLLISEYQRCCTDADQDTSEANRDLFEEIGLDYPFEDICTCPTWGSRTYSGLGVIEPFTSIIALRVFRFVAAAFFVNTLYKKEASNKGKGKDKKEDSSHDTDKDSGPHSHSGHGGHDHGHEDHGHGHGHGAGESILELWERAMSEHPDIVDKYGQFSGELLQAMLGLQVETHSHSSDVSALSQPASTENHMTELQKVLDDDKPETWDSHIKLNGNQYSKLPPQTQGLIIAGRLGKPVKMMQDPVVTDVSVGQLPTVTEGTTMDPPAKRGLVEFEVDKEKMRAELHTKYKFVAPFAPLIRSMRRCDRRHLPLLTKWVAVDVVMTQFEIVYFEAKEYLDCTNETEEHNAPVEACRSALRATKGGKGLRLIDVAAGRKVIGHVDLADVTEVHVEQDEETVKDAALLEKTAEIYQSKDDLDMEYWCDGSKYPSEVDPKRFARKLRWTMEKEERLKLVTNSGTLLFRFYSDLANTESEKLGKISKVTNCIIKDIAFQWAETVVRLCGPEQLKQNLPHFGENNDDELRDYLEIVHFHKSEAEKQRKKVGVTEPRTRNTRGTSPGAKKPRLRRSVSLSTPEDVESGREPSSNVKKSVLRPTKSFGESERSSERSSTRTNPTSHRRGVSLGGLMAPETDDDGKIVLT